MEDINPELVRVVAVAVRRSKFERNGRVGVFEDENISDYELMEARAAIETVVIFINEALTATAE